MRRSLKTLLILSIFFLLILSCSQTKRGLSVREKPENFPKTTNSKNIYGNHEFQLQDLSGLYRLSRNIYKKSGKIYFESKLLNPNKTREALEKSQIILKKYNKNGKNILVPVISQFTTWIDKKKYFSQIKINTSKKVFEIYTEPENVKAEVGFVNSNWICPFSLLPECLGLSGYVSAGAQGKWRQKSIWVMWDNHPYQQKFYENVSPSMFTRARLIFEGTKNGYYQISVEISGQSISLLFTPGYQFEKMIWVAQGLSLTVQ